MTIFGTKKNKPAAAPKEMREAKDASGKLSGVLTAPWLSEKALIGTEKGVYVFHVPAEATKRDVMLAVKKTYNVVPRKVTMVNLPAKKVALRTRRGFGSRSARRKAYVHLAKGDSIQFA